MAKTGDASSDPDLEMTEDKNDSYQNSKTKEAEAAENEAANAPPAREGILKELEGDKMHVLVLFFLYVLQGIPLGLGNSIPLILTERDVAYKEQAMFSFAGYPFAMKLLWAPLVDSVYLAKFGRRKSWLVPVQYLIGITMLILSQYVDYFLGIAENPKDNTPPDVTSLTALFFILNFLAATQDVAVDGWALTMLKPKNVGYAATCNSVGQTTGWCLGYILYTNLESYDVLDLSQFLLFWGIVFLITTTLIAIFKTEKHTSSGTAVAPEVTSDGDAEHEQPDLGLIETYKVLWKMLRHPLIQVMMVVLFTFSFGFSASDSMTNLKMIENGVPREKITQLAIPMIPVKILFTIFISRYTVGPRPMNVWLYSFLPRLVLGLAMLVIVYIPPLLISEDGGLPTAYYVLVIAMYAVHRVFLYAMFVAIMAFFARISDPAVGGTFMTFLNTITNLGGMWPSSFVLWFVDLITVKNCVPETEGTFGSPLISNRTISTSLFSNETLSTFFNATSLEDNVCLGADEVKACKAGGMTCETITEGYYILSGVCFAVGFLWFVWGWRTIRKLQTIEVQEWRVVNKVQVPEDEKKQKDEQKFKYFYCF